MNQPTTLTVLAKPGLRVPLEGGGGRTIDGGPADADPSLRQSVTVPDTPYYRQQIAVGDLEIAADPAPAPDAKPAAKTTKGKE